MQLILQSLLYVGEPEFLENDAIQQKAKRHVCFKIWKVIVLFLPRKNDCFRALHHYT